MPWCIKSETAEVCGSRFVLWGNGSWYQFELILIMLFSMDIGARSGC